jgi:hypothetical protein
MALISGEARRIILWMCWVTNMVGKLYLEVLCKKLRPVLPYWTHKSNAPVPVYCHTHTLQIFTTIYYILSFATTANLVKVRQAIAAPLSKQLAAHICANWCVILPLPSTHSMQQKAF